MAWMEPYPGVSYDDVPWYRKTWFFMVLLFTIFPLTAVIVLTGDLYQKANRRNRKHSDAEVWRSTGSGRAVMLVSAALVGALASVQYWAAFTSSDSNGTGRTPPVAVQVTPESTTTTTLAPSTTLPDSEGFPEFVDDLQSIGVDAFAAQDPSGALALLSDEFGDLPAVGAVRLVDFGLVTSGHADGTSTYRGRVNYLTDVSVAEAAEVFRSANVLEIPVSGEETETTEAGEVVDFEYFSSQSPHPDPDVEGARSFVTVEDTEAGVSVTITASITYAGPLSATVPQSQLVGLLPLAEGYENDGTEVSFITIEPMATTPSFSIAVTTTSVRPLDGTDDAAEAARFADVAEAGGLWSRSAATDTGERLERLDGAFESNLFVSARSTSDANIVRVSLIVG